MKTLAPTPGSTCASDDYLRVWQIPQILACFPLGTGIEKMRRSMQHFRTFPVAIRWKKIGTRNDYALAGCRRHYT
jgi:hypothetical protein